MGLCSTIRCEEGPLEGRLVPKWTFVGTRMTHPVLIDFPRVSAERISAGRRKKERDQEQSFDKLSRRFAICSRTASGAAASQRPSAPRTSYEQWWLRTRSRFMALAWPPFFSSRTESELKQVHSNCGHCPLFSFFYCCIFPSPVIASHCMVVLDISLSGISRFPM